MSLINNTSPSFAHHWLQNDQKHIASHNSHLSNSFEALLAEASHKPVASIRSEVIFVPRTNQFYKQEESDSSMMQLIGTHAPATNMLQQLTVAIGNNKADDSATRLHVSDLNDSERGEHPSFIPPPPIFPNIESIFTHALTELFLTDEGSSLTPPSNFPNTGPISAPVPTELFPTNDQPNIAQSLLDTDANGDREVSGVEGSQDPIASSEGVNNTSTTHQSFHSWFNHISGHELDNSDVIQWLKG